MAISIYQTSIGHPTASQGISHRKYINETIFEALANSGVEQVVDFPTRDNNLLDTFATNRPSLVESCKQIPGVSDHEIVHVSSDISAKYQQPIKRKIWLWSKADLPSLKTDMQSFSQHLTEKNSIKTNVNILGTEFSKKCLELMKKHVPSKVTSSRYSQPWINQDLKRFSRRKKKAYMRAKYKKDKEEGILGSLQEIQEGESERMQKCLFLPCK